MITVNTNYPATSQEDLDRVVDDLDQAIRKAFKNDRKEMIKFVKGPPNFNGMRMQSDFRIEQGPTTGFVHAHILLEVNHRSHIRLNIPFVRQTIASYGTTAPVKRLPYCNVVGFSSRESVLKYIRKGDNPARSDKTFAAFALGDYHLGGKTVSRAV